MSVLQHPVKTKGAIAGAFGVRCGGRIALHLLRPADEGCTVSGSLSSSGMSCHDGVEPTCRDVASGLPRFGGGQPLVTHVRVA